MHKRMKDNHKIRISGADGKDTKLGKGESPLGCDVLGPSENNLWMVFRFNKLSPRGDKSVGRGV